jgi:hypothetical protein
VAAYFSRPLVAECFGAATTIDDWQTIYESATRLSEYARFGGFNCAVVNVLADGSAIYPSEHLAASSIRNVGRATGEATDRDALELMLRIFDRDGLAMIPALQLAAPIPALEELCRAENPQVSGLEWVGPNGKTWLDVNGTQHGLAPYYNLLDTRVQQAVLQIVRELVERYGHHESLAGISIQLSSNGYAQLPPLDWGLDDATISQFTRDTGVPLPVSGPNRFAERHALLTGKHAEAWRAWRTQSVASFYAQIAALLQESSDDRERKLILTLENSFSHPIFAARVRPNLLQANQHTNRVDATLLDAGIDRAKLESTRGVVVCATRYIESMAPLAERAIDCELNDAFAAWKTRADANTVSASLLYHRPLHQPLASFPSQASNLKFADEFSIHGQPTAHGNAILQPVAQSLIQHDPAILIEGGEMLPLSHDDRLRQAREITRQLPMSAEVRDVAKQPVTVRTYAEPGRVTLLVINASAWSVAADITLDVPQPAKMTPLASETQSDDVSQRPLQAGRQPWKLTLEPYAIHAVRVNAPGVRVINVSAAPNESAKAELAARIADLANRDLTAPRAYGALTNPSFEPVGGAGPLAGWHVTTESASAQLDAANRQHGATCVYFRNEGGLAALESDPFPTPPTGQLAMIVYLRGQKMAPGSQLRMAIEARDHGHVYRRSAIIETTSAGTDQWLSKAILVNDLPLELRGNMKVRVEMTGPGEVWLDNVTLYDLLFALKFYTFDEAEIYQFVQLKSAAKSALDEGRIVDAAQLMERYWPRFLFEYTPVIEPAIAAQSVAQPPLAAPPKENEQPVPGISERIKRVFPFVK